MLDMAVNIYPHLRCVHENLKTGLRVVEMPPCVRSVRLVVESEGWDQPPHPPRPTSLAFPYTYYIYNTKSPDEPLHLGVGNNPIQGLTDKIYFPPFTNIYPTFKVCQDGSDDPISTFWQSSFQHMQQASEELGSGSYTSWPGAWVYKYAIGSIERWKQLGIPAILKIDWPLHTSLGQLVRRYGMDSLPLETHWKLSDESHNELQESLRSW